MAVNNPGVPCASTPAADEGTTLTPGHLLEGGNVGDWSGSAGFTPPTPGAYVLCGWFEEPAGLIETDGGPSDRYHVFAGAGSRPVISLKLSLPRPPQPGRPFVLNLTATSEVQRHVVVEGMTATRHGCPINYAVENDQHLIDQDVTGGPWRLASDVEPLRRGTYIFCAWADPTEDSGLEPQASTSLTVHFGTQAPASRPRERHRHPLAERPATRTEFAAIDRYFRANRAHRCTSQLAWVHVSTVDRSRWLTWRRAGHRGGSARLGRPVDASRRSPMRACAAASFPRASSPSLEMERYNEGPQCDTMSHALSEQR